MPRLAQAPLASRISLTAALLTSICLLLTLPALGWWVGTSVGNTSTTRPAPDLAELKSLAKALEQEALDTVRQRGQTVHAQLTSDLLLHADTMTVGEIELPLVTFRKQALPDSGKNLADLLATGNETLMLFVRDDDAFFLAAQASAASSTDAARKGADDAVKPQSGLADGASAGPVRPGSALGNDLQSLTKLPPGQADTVLLSQGNRDQAAYVRPLRNSAGDVSALLVLTRELDQRLSDAVARLQAGMPVSAGNDKRGGSSYAPALAAAGAALALLISGLLWLIVRSAVTAALQPLKELTGCALRMGNGDLGTRLPAALSDGQTKTRNELTLLARSLNRMVEQISELLSTVKSGAQSVAHSASEVSDAAQRLNEGSRGESQAATGMAAAVEEMTTSIRSVGQNAEEARGISQRAHELVSEGSAAVASATTQMQTLSETVQTTSAVIAQLGEQSQQISAIAAMIKEIAEQTNLLALNAAIEAARAGDNGRGFSVVADEVRRLAERTSDSTENIRNMIDAIQVSANTAVSNMDSAVSSVHAGVELVTHVGETIARIHDDASHVANAVDAIHLALREQNAASNSIAQQVDCVAQMSGSNRASAEQALHTSANMEQTARQMLDALQRFGQRKAG